MNRRTFLLSPLMLLDAASGAGRKPNVVLIVARGWRGVSTPWNGDRDVQAPNVAAFAAESVVFPKAYAAYPHPSPARGAIASGRYPHATGVFGDGATLRKDDVTLGSVLRGAGYRVIDDPAATARETPFFLNLILEPPRLAVKGVARLRQNISAGDADLFRDRVQQAYGAYQAMDEQFGKLVGAIDPANTIVVFTSDAGDQIGSHGLDGDDIYFEESARVPLVIRYPGVLRASASEIPVSHVDLMPTILGLCGEGPVENIQGRDLSGLLTSGRGDRPESVLVEGRIGQRDEWRMLVLGSDKVVVDAAGEPTHLFNLATDPYEMSNVVHDPGVALKRAQMLATIRAERSRVLDFKRR